EGGDAPPQGLARHRDCLAAAHGADIAAAGGGEEGGDIAVIIIKLQLAADLLPAGDASNLRHGATRGRGTVVVGAGLGGHRQVKLAGGSASRNGPDAFRTSREAGSRGADIDDRAIGAELTGGCA